MPIHRFIMVDFKLETAMKAVRARRTEAEIRADEERQAQARGRLDPNSPAMQKARAERMERDMATQLIWLKKQPPSELRDTRIEAMMNRMGELVAMQGDYSRAATITHDPKRREHYRGIRAAIKRPDGETCKCEDDRLLDRAKNQEFVSPAVMTIDNILTPDGAKRLDRCRKCGFLNARS